MQDSLDAELVKKQQVKAEYIAIIDDGVTSREVKVNAVADSLTPEGMQAMGESFTEMSLNAVRDRQNEIDNNKKYYTKFERMKPKMKSSVFVLQGINKITGSMKNLTAENHISNVRERKRFTLQLSR